MYISFDISFKQLVCRGASVAECVTYKVSFDINRPFLDTCRSFLDTYRSFLTHVIVSFDISFKHAVGRGAGVSQMCHILGLF